MINWVSSFFFSTEIISDDKTKWVKKVKNRRNRHMNRKKKMNRKLFRSSPDYGAIPKHKSSKSERVNGVSRERPTNERECPANGRDDMLLELEKRSVICSDIWSDDLLKQQFLLHCK